jgi:hypothetical protein
LTHGFRGASHLTLLFWVCGDTVHHGGSTWQRRWLMSWQLRNKETGSVWGPNAHSSAHCPWPNFLPLGLPSYRFHHHIPKVSQAGDQALLSTWDSWGACPNHNSIQKKENVGDRGYSKFPSGHTKRNEIKQVQLVLIVYFLWLLIPKCYFHV